MNVRRIAATQQRVNAKLKVAVYCRVSTKLTEQEDSLEVQQSTYTAYIQSKPEWAFAGMYADTRSGLNTSKRPGFMQMMADAENGKIDMILCKSISRFSRNIVECQRYIERLKAKNITVVFEKENIRTDVPASNLIFSLMCAIAQDESRSISENMKTANRHRVEAGIYIPHKNQMLGYDVEKGKLVPNKDAWIVLYIFSRFSENAGVNEICRELNAQGANRMSTEKPFTHDIIRYMLTNETYVGDKRLQKQPPRNFLTKRPDDSQPYATNYITDDHEAIVSREMWEKVQHRLETEKAARKSGINRRLSAHEYYGRVICGNCGQLYIRRTFKEYAPKGVAPEKYHVWYCRGRTHKNGCKNPSIREEVLAEKMVAASYATINDRGEAEPTSSSCGRYPSHETDQPFLRV